MDTREDYYEMYHCHTELSLLDSCTKYQEYVDLAVKNGQKALSISEHGKPMNWTEKWAACKKAGLRYIHSVEIYLTEQLEPKVRDNYHTVLMARNMAGVLELNELITKSCDKKKQDEYKKRLGDRWRARPELGDLVFTSTVGSPVTRYVIVHDINKVVQDINLKEISKAFREHREPVVFEHLHPHAFRHTFATRCFEKGLDPLFVQSIMGHASYSTTVSYTHILDDLRQREVEKVGNFLE